MCWQKLLFCNSGLFFVCFFLFLSYVSDLVIPSTRHFLGSHSVGASQASANSHRLHGLIWCIHTGIHSPWEASDIAISCERRWEDGWRGWWTQGLTGASRGGDRTWCNSIVCVIVTSWRLWFLQYVAVLCSLKSSDLAAGGFLEQSDKPLPLCQCGVALGNLHCVGLVKYIQGWLTSRPLWLSWAPLLHVRSQAGSYIS